MTLLRQNRLWTGLLILLAGVYLGVATWELSVVWLWDDAYMFSRYAHNILNNGAIAWNPDGVPTYGATSLLYLAVVTFFTALGILMAYRPMAQPLSYI